VKEVQVRTEREHSVSSWCHDLYKPQTMEQQSVLEKMKTDLFAFARQVSDAAFSLDRGMRPPEPPVPDCPDFVRDSFGCPAIS
jgi:hypothetical protein